MQKIKKYIYVFILILALILSSINIIKCKADYITLNYNLGYIKEGIRFKQLAKEINTSNWTCNNASNCIGQFTSGSQWGNCFCRTTNDFIDGHKYLINCKIKLTTATDQVSVRIGRSGYAQNSVINCVSTTEWQTLIGVVQFQLNNAIIPGDNNYIILMDSRASNWDEIKFKEYYVIDVSEAGLDNLSDSQIIAFFNCDTFKYQIMTANEYYILKDLPQVENLTSLPASGNVNSELVIGSNYYVVSEEAFYYINSITLNTSNENHYVNDYTWEESFYDYYTFNLIKTTYSQAFAVGGAEGYDTGYLEGLRNTEEGYILGYTEGQTAGNNSGYTSGYTSGHNAGYDEGYDTGHDEGYDEGYDEGDTDGYARGYNDLDAYADDMTLFMKALFQGFEDFFNIHIGSVTIGAIILIPLSISLAWFIIKQFRGGSN